MYLQAFVAGATLRGASIDSIASTSSGILVNASGAVSLGVASTYGTWQLTGLLFTYDPTQKVVEASGQYSISLPGQISGAGGDLNLYRLASNFLDDVPHLNGDLGDTGDMSQADYTTDHGVFTWVPTDGNTFPGQMTDLLSIKVVGDFYDLDAPAQGIGSCPIQAAYKPTLRIDLTANVSGYHMIPGFIYDEAKSKLFFEDNVGITPVILASSSTETEFMYSVDIKSEALPGDGTGLDANFNATVLEGVSILQAVYFLEELDEPTNRLVGHISSTDGINLQGSVEVPLRPSAEYDKGFFVLAMPCQ